ncbi:MAG: serine/threonine-protein kinase, partial [Myxococcota bacterium]|nr:serine/threonine-protein kinase [Myxococcota bacterium]
MSEPKSPDDDSPNEAPVRRVTMREQALLETLSEDVDEEPRQLRSASTNMPRVGDLLEGRYKILSILGDGGFGVVYKAMQLATEQLVAIKVLLPERLAISAKEATAAAQRFRREMKIVGDLRHRNIVKLVDSGTLDNGLLFMVLEYVEGDELSDLIKRYAKKGELIPVAESKRLMMQVLSALSVAHAKGYVHRDLKPQNIMIATSGLERDAVVLDFGIAGVLEQAQGEDHVRLTKTRQALGTVSYMSREQALGETTPQTDIYAWGLIFLECLTGHVAVVADTPYAAILVHCSDAPIPIPEPIASHPLGAILAKATAKSLEERYHDVRQLYDELAACELSELSLSYSGTRPIGALELTTGGGLRVVNAASTKSQELGGTGEAPNRQENVAPARSNTLLLALLAVAVLILAGVAAVSIMLATQGPSSPTSS